MIIVKAKDYNELSKKAATIILNEVMLDPSITLGLATGSTPLGLYKELINAHKNMNVDFSKITTFNLDEYYPIKKINNQSYDYFMQENLFKDINIKKENIHILNGETKDPEEECEDYEEKLMDNGIDIQILGIGANGHIAFNEPGSSFDSKTRIVKLDEQTIKDNSRFFEKEEDVPKKALSMGLSSIMSAKKIILLATGKNKAEAVKKMVEGPITPNCPASLLQKHPEVIVIVSEDAEHLLEESAIPSKLGGYRIITEENLPRNKKVVIISPHPDDSAIGPGATMVMLSKKNKVHTFVMTTGHRSYIPNTTKEERANIREDEVLAESAILKSEPHLLRLGYYDDEKELDNDLKILEQKLKKINPDIVMIPQIKDEHITHIRARELTLKALKNLKMKVELWNYESPWGLFNKGAYNAIVSVPSNDFFSKLQSIEAHKSQVERTNYTDVAESLAKLRGALIPEQELYGFGNKSHSIKPRLEIFYIEQSE